jgi:hypothetical protein
MTADEQACPLMAFARARSGGSRGWPGHTQGPWLGSAALAAQMPGLVRRRVNAALLGALALCAQYGPAWKPRCEGTVYAGRNRSVTQTSEALNG